MSFGHWNLSVYFEHIENICKVTKERVRTMSGKGTASQLVFLSYQAHFKDNNNNSRNIELHVKAT